MSLSYDMICGAAGIDKRDEGLFSPMFQETKYVGRSRG